MRAFGILAFLGGVAAGVTLGVLLAPDKGANTRHQIVHVLEAKGVIMSKEQLEAFVAKVKARLRCGYTHDELKRVIEELFLAEEKL